jgi:hypothetical protein
MGHEKMNQVMLE